MKILFVANKGSNHAKKCADGLAELGHEIVFISPNDPIDKSVELDSRIKLITLKFGGKKGYILNFMRLRKIYKNLIPDVVNVHYATGCGLLAFLSRLHPVVLNCYGSDIFEFPHKSILHKLLVRLILKNAKVCASTSYAMAEEIRKITGNADQDIVMTPFGVNTDVFKPAENKEHNERPVIGIVKSFLPVYDIPLLIEGFSLVHKKMDVKPVLKIYGDGPLKRLLQDIAKETGVGDDIHFMGRIPNSDVPKVLNQFDIFVNCSKQESFGVNILEAMACELPVIATDCVGPRELIEDGVSGIILRDRNPETLASAIVNILNDKKKHRSLGLAGRKRVLERYDWGKNLLELEKVLKSNCRINL